MVKKKTISINNTELGYNIGNIEWIKGYENYYNQFLKFQKYFDASSLEILHYIFQIKLLSKRLSKRYIQLECFSDKKNLALRNELIEFNYPVGKLFLEGYPMNVYMYGGFFTLMKIYNSYALIHECFIKNSYFSYIKNNDIIDIGSGNGLSCFCLSKYTDGKVYCFEASSKVYDLFQESIKLNNKQEKIASYNLAIGSKKQSIYVSNGIGNDNVTSLNIQSSSILMDTIDNLVKELNIRPKMINIWVNGDEYECLMGMLSTIKTFKPILHINISYSAEILFQVINLATRLLSDYSFKIQKTTEPHIVQELFLIAIPHELN